MHTLTIAGNISKFRHSRKITQEQLASFMGVTKASVSKWETGQSVPDVTLLPQLAAFFDVTIDELVGYNPQLSKEQIQKLYLEFTEDFAAQPFEAVMDKTHAYVKRYYSCYPFLVQICILWLNHYTLAQGEANQSHVLEDLDQLCGHILQGSRSLELCNDVLAIQAMGKLALGKPLEAIDALEETFCPTNLARQSDMVLTQAYLAAADTDKADRLTQICMYNHLLGLVAGARTYLAIHTGSLGVCETTIARIEQLCGIFALEQLHPNSMATFEYQAALCYAAHKEKQQTLRHLRTYLSCLEALFSPGCLALHGDAYFTRINEWFEELGSGVHAPRNRNVILNDAKQTLSHPAFSFLEGESGFEKLKEALNHLK